MDSFPVADAAAFNSNGTKTLLANGVSTFFINGKAIVMNGLRKLRNPPSGQLVFLVVLKYFLIKFLYFLKT